jgi:hypothetical protein
MSSPLLGTAIAIALHSALTVRGLLAMDRYKRRTTAKNNFKREHPVLAVSGRPPK